MIKHRKIKLLSVIVIACILLTPATKSASDTCPSVDTYIQEYLNLNGSGSTVGERAYVKNGDIITYSIKPEYIKYVTIYAGEDLITPDANGNVSIDIAKYDEKGGVVSINFVSPPLEDKKSKDDSKKDNTSATTNSAIKPAENCSAQLTQTFTSGGGRLEFNQGELNDIQNSLNEISNLQKENTTITPGFDDPISGDFTKVSDPTKATKLMCKYDKDSGKTVQKYTHTGQKDTGDQWCKVTCREDVVVSMDPPVITQSGMCFSYVADIKTKSVCKAEYLKPAPVLHYGCTAPSYCSGGTDKGGPNESFDSCVNSCDGGEYTQSCINKCYNKVYGSTEEDTTTTEKKSTTKKVSNTTTDTKKDTTTKDSENEGVTYLNNLKTNYQFIEPTKLASGYIDIGGSVGKVRCYTDTELAVQGVSAEDVYNSKKYLPGGTYANGGWTPTAGYYSINQKGEKVWHAKGGCPSKINYHYFASLGKTSLTLSELNGTFKFPRTGNIHVYAPEDAGGALRRIRVNGDYNECQESCGTSSMCQGLVNGYNAYGTNNKGQTVQAYDKDQNIVTKEQAKMIFDAEVKKWKEDQKKCKASANDCTTLKSNYVIQTSEISKNSGKDLGEKYTSNQNGKNITASGEGGYTSMVINTNGRCVTGSCENKSSEYCSNLDSTKNSSELVTYCNDKESCKNSGTPGCKNGNICYDHHTTISFPKNYMNVKTGQTKVEISKDKLPYYVSLGNAYCTNLSTKEVNTAWYDYKLDDTNKTAKPAESKIKKNITAKINDYGIFKWNFDLSCFFAIKNPTTGECNGDDCKEKKCTGTDCDDGVETPLSNAKVRSVDTTDLFPNREPRFNWSSKAKNVSNQSYKIDPESLVKEIETLGDAVYDTDKENQNVDYHIVLTPSDINDVRKYNKEKKTYNEDIYKGLGVNKIAGEKVWGVTVYRSNFLDEHKKIVLKRGLLGCNNQSSANTCATEGGK